MRKVIALIISLLLATPSWAEHSERHWYEYAGITLSGIGWGALLGPVNVAVFEADKRGEIDNDFGNTEAWYVFGGVVHMVLGVGLAIVAPPAAYAYFGSSAIYGSAQFWHRGRYALDK